MKKHIQQIRKALKKEEGFTLIELMIVVGIIGILVAIAAPNFARYQSKARQSESKIALAAVYGGEKSFYSEYSSYIGDMTAIGYTPEGNKRFYSLGWSTGVAANSTSLISGFTTPGTAVPNFARINFPGTWASCTPALSAVPVATSTDPQVFTVTASGQIRDGQPCDIWTIDENKVMRNTVVSL
jgi:prepilin-type N-terminal cleavage/methylation domain-containing protein